MDIMQLGGAAVVGRLMLMAIIEFELNPGVEDESQRLTQKLLPRLSEIDGFVGEDPAASLNHEGRMYEISHWRDDEALAEWSRHLEHVAAKDQGRAKLLRWYRIRVGTWGTIGLWGQRLPRKPRSPQYVGKVGKAIAVVGQNHP